MLDRRGQMKGVERLESVLRPNPRGSVTHGWQYGQ